MGQTERDRIPSIHLIVGTRWCLVRPARLQSERAMSDSSTNSTTRQILLIILLGAVMCSPTFGQKGNKPKGGMKPGKPIQGIRGGGGRDKNEQLLARNLPTAFQSLSDAQVLLLSSLCQRSVSWINRRDLMQPDAACVADVFGHFQLASTDIKSPSASTESKTSRNTQIENTGLLVLTKLNLDQRQALAKVLPEQNAEVMESIALRNSLVDLIHTLRDQKVAPRSADGEARKRLRELCRLETSIAVRQARAFAELNESLSKDQRQSLELICRSPVETKPSTEATQEIHEELQIATSEVKIAFQRLAARAALWIGINNETMTTPSSMDFELTSSTEPPSEHFLPTFLIALSAPQQQQLIALLAGRARAETQVAGARQQALSSLIELRTSRALDERQLQVAMESMLETMFSTGYAEASGFEQLMNSFSKAQREHLESALGITFPPEIPDKKTSKGKA